MNEIADRRRFWRAAFEAEVRLVGAAESTPAELVDISLKGALVKLPPRYSVGMAEPCELDLKLADDATIVMRGVVAHIEGRQIGVRCTDIDLDSITHLRRLVELNAGDSALLDRELAALLN
ncbi:MAG: PilZ domain-containing protein [Gammaproteobacteria bacterium]|nr:PilZ domain-containing protein [Gammaproteobacteria bacterium]MBU1415147.1 PilZ domain-containing protein [Gammaproteobacteria bacterium]